MPIDLPKTGGGLPVRGYGGQSALALAAAAARSEQARTSRKIEPSRSWRLPLVLRTRLRSLAALILTFFAASLLHAQDQTNAPTPMSVTIKTELPRQVPQMHRAYVNSDTNKFAFIIPEGFGLINEPASGILKFANHLGSAMITLKVLDPLPLDDGQLKPEVCRELLQSRHPKGRILEEFSGNAAGRTGPGFDLAWETSDGGAQRTRTVFVPFDGGVLEFTATTGPDQFTSLHGALNQMMGTFSMSDKQGKLEVSLLSDRL